jgi:hypothetical protein
MDLRNLSFIKNTINQICDIEIVDITNSKIRKSLDNEPGCYIFGAKHGYQYGNKVQTHQNKIYFDGDEPIAFPYPLGLSPVMYIGESKNLKIRMEKHLNAFNKINNKVTKYAPRGLGSYVKSFGFKVAIIKYTGHKELEKDLLHAFNNKFGSIPVCNGQFTGRKKIVKENASQ